MAGLISTPDSFRWIFGLNPLYADPYRCWELGSNSIWKKFSSQTISRSYSLFGNCSHSIRNGTSNLHHSLHGSFTLPSVQYQLTLPEVVWTKCFSSNISNSEEKIIKKFSLIKKEQPHFTLSMHFLKMTFEIFVKPYYSS